MTEGRNRASCFCAVAVAGDHKTHTSQCMTGVFHLQAARAYDAAAIVIRGPTARTNFTYPLQLLHLKSKRGKVSTTSFAW